MLLLFLVLFGSYFYVVSQYLQLYILMTGVYNASSGDVSLYINGKYYGGGPGGTSQATTGNFVIGSQSSQPIGNGIITNVQVYNAALSSNQINAIY